MTQTEQRSVSTHVDALADQVLTGYQQRQQREKQRQQDQTDQQDKQAIAVLQILLATEIEADLLSALSPSYEVQHDSSGSQHAEAIFTYAGVNWRIAQEFPNRSHESWRWSIRVTTRDHWHNSQISDLTTNASPLALRVTLLLKLGERRQQIQKQEQEALEKERTKQQEEAQATAEKEREMREREERIAQADQEHARWQEQLETLKSRELARLWRWPTGVLVALYQIAYTSGVGRGDEDEAIIEQVKAWTGTDHLDQEGYIRLEPERSYWSNSEPREIKLDPSTHMPIWQRIIVGSTDELPQKLREDITVSIPNVYSQRDHDQLDGKCRLTYIEDGRYLEDSPHSELVGRQPLPWVRALVDQAAAKANTPDSTH